MHFYSQIRYKGWRNCLISVTLGQKTIFSEGLYVCIYLCIVLHEQNYKVWDVDIDLWWINWCVGISSLHSEEKWGLLDTWNLFLRSKKSEKINRIKINNLDMPLSVGERWKFTIGRNLFWRIILTLISVRKNSP